MYDFCSNQKIYGIAGEDTFEVTLSSSSISMFAEYKFNVYDYIIMPTNVFLMYKNPSYVLETGEPTTTILGVRFSPNGFSVKYPDIKIPENIDLESIEIPVDFEQYKDNTYCKFVKFLSIHDQKIHGEVLPWTTQVDIIGPVHTESFNVSSIDVLEPYKPTWNLFDALRITFDIGNKRVENIMTYSPDIKIKAYGEIYELNRSSALLLKDHYDMECRLAGI